MTHTPAQERELIVAFARLTACQAEDSIRAEPNEGVRNLQLKARVLRDFADIVEACGHWEHPKTPDLDSLGHPQRPLRPVR